MEAVVNVSGVLLVMFALVLFPPVMVALFAVVFAGVAIYALERWERWII